MHCLPDNLHSRTVPERLQRDVSRHLHCLLVVLPGWPVPERLQRDLCRSMHLLFLWLHLSWGTLGSSTMQRRFVLRQRVVSCNLVPERIRLPSRVVCPSTLSVRLQVPRRIAEHDRVRSALLLPQPGLLKPDPLPSGVLLRYQRNVHAQAVPAGIFRVLSRQGSLQQLLRRALLSECHDLHPLPIWRLLSACFRVADSVPRRFPLPDWFVCPAALPRRFLLPGRCDGGHRLPCGEFLSRDIVRSNFMPVKLSRWNEHLLVGRRPVGLRLQPSCRQSRGARNIFFADRQ